MGLTIRPLYRSREQTPLIQVPDSLYAFRTSDKCHFSSSGWVFGSNSDRCDFLLAENNKTGVSGRHFSLEVDKRARVLLLRNWSGHKTKVVTDIGKMDVSTVMVINESAIIQAGLAEISVSVPMRNRTQRDAYERCLDIFLSKVEEGVPEFHGLEFRSASLTPAILRGDKSDYIITQTLGTGVFGIVYLAYAPTQQKSARFFAVKEYSDVHGTDKARAEIDLLRRLSHVRLREVLCNLINQ